MYKKMMVVAVLAAVGGLAVSVEAKNSPKYDADKVYRSLVAATDPIEQYRKQIKTETEPSYENLLPVLTQLTVYNEVFASRQEIQKLRVLASKLATPVTCGWNNYRPVGLKEVFERYVPLKNQTVKELGLLEYYVNFYTLSQEQQDGMKVFGQIEAAAPLQAAYDQFVIWATNKTEYSEKEILEHLVPFIEAYNAMYEQHPEIVRLAHKSLFKQPFLAGWNRVHTLSDLRVNLGVIHDYGYRTAKDIEQTYQVSGQTAQIFADFVSNYRLR